MIISLATDLEEAAIPFSFDAGTALFLQGVESPPPDDIDLSVPWDLLPEVHRLFATEAPTPIADHGGWAKFTFWRAGIPVDLLSYKGTDLATDPDRVPVDLGAGRTAWAKSLSFFRRNLPPEDPRHPAIARLLAEK